MSDTMTPNRPLNGTALPGPGAPAARIDPLVRDHLALRLGVDPAALAGWPWAVLLSQQLGPHPLVLELVAGLLLRAGNDREGWQLAATRLTGYLGQAANGDAPTPPADGLLARVLAYCYAELGAFGQRRLRALGVFAPGASMSVAAVALVWECTHSAARRQLSALRKAGMLARDQSGWQLHPALHPRIRALPPGDGDAQFAARHAAAYLAALRQATQERQLDRLRAEYPQLRQAYGWAVAHDLRLALTLLAELVELQALSGQLHDGLRWSATALAQAQAQGDPAVLAEALALQGTLLQRLAQLPEQDQQARLLAALAAYDAALDHATALPPLAAAAIQHQRAQVLAGLAAAGQDRPARLLAALAAYDAALQIRTPATAPAAYVASQGERAALLGDLALLPGQDRPARLLAALAAYDAALSADPPDPLVCSRMHHQRAAVLIALADTPGEPVLQWLLAALAAYDAALAPLDPALAPLPSGAIHSDRASLLRRLARQPGEDRHARLLAALAAYDAALCCYTPTLAPTAHAAAQQRRAGLLGLIAGLPGEDRSRRLLEAIQAYDAALRFCDARQTPDLYITLQDNRASLLTDLAEQPDEQRWLRLRTALKAYDDALAVFVPSQAPLAYARMQQRRGNLSIMLAGFAWEERRIRLQVAHNAFSEALRFYTPAQAPQVRAITLGTLAGVYQALAELPGMDRLAHLEGALQVAWEAHSLFGALEQPALRERAAAQLVRLRAACRFDFAELWAGLGVGAPPVWLDPAAQIAPQIAAFLSAADSQALLALWQQVPPEFRLTFLDAVELLITQAEQSGDQRAGELRQRLAVVRQIDLFQREPAIAARWQAFEAALAHYRAAFQAAEQQPHELDSWYTAAEAGEALHSAEFADLPGVDHTALQAALAHVYARLALVLGQAGDLHGAFAANSRAIELQPESALWRRNRAAILLQLGWLSEAAQVLAVAQELDPTTPHLTELELALRSSHG